MDNHFNLTRHKKLFWFNLLFVSSICLLECLEWSWLVALLSLKDPSEYSYGDFISIDSTLPRSSFRHRFYAVIHLIFLVFLSFFLFVNDVGHVWQNFCSEQFSSQFRFRVFSFNMNFVKSHFIGNIKIVATHLTQLKCATSYSEIATDIISSDSDSD